MAKQIDFTPATHSLNQVLFDVEKIPLFVKIPENAFHSKEVNISKYEGLINSRDKTLLSVVTKQYELVTNEQALESGKQIFCELFPSVKKEDLIPYKVIASKKLTCCHIDLIHKDVKLNQWKQDTWLPFLRISNSYNRTFALTYEIGFVRELCSNGYIFDKNSIKVKYNHTKGEIPLDIKIDVSELRRYEMDFVNYMNNLNRFYVDPVYVFPLLLKALDLNFKIENKDTKSVDQIIARYFSTKSLVGKLTSHYYQELKPTAYAVLNIITDFISHQQDYKTIPLFSSHINNYYKMPSLWILDFTKEIQKPNFNMENYLGDYKQYLN